MERSIVSDQAAEEPSRWLMPGIVAATILALLIAYLQRGWAPFSEPISDLHGGGPGSWGYHAVLAGFLAMVGVGGWAAARLGRWTTVAVMAACAALLIVLACHPDGSRLHEPTAMLLGVAGLVWMASMGGTATAALPAPWLGLVGVLLLATARDRPVAIGEAFLLAGALSASLGDPAAALASSPAGMARSAGLSARLTLDLGRLVAPLLRTPGLGWGVFMLLVTSLSGSLAGHVVLPAAVLIAGWAAGWFLSRWDPGLTLAIVIRVGAPGLVLTLADADGGPRLVALLVLVSGGLLLNRMVRAMYD